MSVFIDAYGAVFDRVVHLFQDSAENVVNTNTKNNEESNRDVLLLSTNGAYLFLFLMSHMLVWLMTSWLLFVINVVTTLLLPVSLYDVLCVCVCVYAYVYVHVSLL